MAIELDKVLEYTGITADTNEAFIEQFQKKFITEDQVFKDKEIKDRIFGRAFGSATTGVKQTFEQFDVELTGDDLKQPIEAVVKLGLQKVNEKFAAQKLELEKTAGLTADEKLKELNDAISKKDSKIKDFEKLLKEKASEFESLQTNQKNQFKQFKVGSINKDVQGAIQWLPEKDEFSKVGFLAKMSEKYVIDLDENDEPFIVDKATNSRIKAEGSHSTFMTPAEVYKQEAIKANMMGVNKKAGQAPANPAAPAKVTPVVQNTQTPTNRRQMANTSFKLG